MEDSPDPYMLSNRWHQHCRIVAFSRKATSFSSDTPSTTIPAFISAQGTAALVTRGTRYRLPLQLKRLIPVFTFFHPCAPSGINSGTNVHCVGIIPVGISLNHHIGRTGKDFKHTTGGTGIVQRCMLYCAENKCPEL